MEEETQTILSPMLSVVDRREIKIDDMKRVYKDSQRGLLLIQMLMNDH